MTPPLILNTQLQEKLGYVKAYFSWYFENFFLLKKLDSPYAENSVKDWRKDGKSSRLIHPLPILTDTDSNRFLGLLTIPIPIPIFIYEYHTDTDTDFAKNTDIPIPIIPIIGLTLYLIPAMYNSFYDNCSQMLAITCYYLQKLDFFHSCSVTRDSLLFSMILDANSLPVYI